MKSRLPFFAVVLLMAALSLNGCSSREEKAARYVERGNKLFDAGQFEKARVEYKNAGRIKPTDPQIAYRFGLIDEAEGDFSAAFAGYNRAEQQDAHYRPALLKLAEYYLAGNQFDDVQKYIDRVLSDDRDNPEAHALHASLLLRQKDLDAADKEVHFALTKDPDNLVAYSVLIGLYVAKDDNAKALAAADEGLKHNPKSLALLLLKADIYDRAGDFEKLAETYTAIFKLAPAEPRYRVNLAATYLKAGRMDDAESALRAGVTALPNDWEMKHQLVLFLNDHRGLEAAEKEIRGYMQTYPDRAELISWLVDLYVSHQANDRAITLLNEVIAKNTFDKPGLVARTAMARLDYMQGDKAAAGNLADTVLEHDPSNLDAMFVKARLEVDKGYYQNAVGDLRGIIRDQPRAREALHLLSEILLLQGHVDLAIDTLNQVVDIDPLNFAARVRLAQMYHINGDSKHAMDLLFFVTKTEPELPVGWESTARIAIDTKDYSTAEMAIGKLDALDGQHLTAVYLRGLLLAKTGKVEDSIGKFTEVINADTTTPIAERALFDLVAAYKSLDRMDEATKYIETLHPRSPAMDTILGENHLASGKSAEAAASFDMAISGKAATQEPYLQRARMYMLENKPDDALATLRRAAAAAPADIRAPLLEAQILGNTGHVEEAIAIYNSLLARNQDLDAVANNLAEIIADYQYKDPAALDKAKNVAERFIGSSNPLFLDTLAWVYYRQGDTQQALTVMQRAFAQEKNLPAQIHYHYGAILLQASKISEAKTELQQAVTKGERFPGSDDAESLLKGL